MSLPATLTVVEHAESFWVQNASGQTVGWFRTDPLVAKTAGVLHKDEARRMAVNFARLPELVGAVAGLDQGQEPGQPGDDDRVQSARVVGRSVGDVPLRHIRPTMISQFLDRNGSAGIGTEGLRRQA